LPPGSAVPANLSGKIWTSIPTSQKVVALTFDAGANADAVPKILATLQAERVPATFFLTGDWVRHYPAQTKQIAWSGYPIGNHSDTHPHFPALTDADRISQLGKADATISAMIGKSTTKPLFRFPFGESAGSLETVNAAGYAAIGWTVDGAGWLGTGKTSADGVYNRVMAKVQPGEIVLMHVGSNPQDRSTLDADALPRIIQQLKSMGYGFTDLRALVG
jgi:peptidoglycan/xylan/chitin deacetylase (PgdA/CDA1 family)